MNWGLLIYFFVLLGAGVTFVLFKKKIMSLFGEFRKSLGEFGGSNNVGGDVDIDTLKDETKELKAKTNQLKATRDYMKVKNDVDKLKKKDNNNKSRSRSGFDDLFGGGI